MREASRGLLPSLLPTLPPQPHLLLLSAVHLQGTAPAMGSAPGLGSGTCPGIRHGAEPEVAPPGPPGPLCPLQPWCHVPTAAWRTPLEVKQTVPLPFLRPGRPPRLVPTMTSKKYPVASFIDPHLQVQVSPPPTSPDLAAWHWEGGL